MITFRSLRVIEKGIFLQFLFMIVVYGLYHFAALLYERRRMHLLRGILIPVSILVDGTILFVYYHIFISARNGRMLTVQFRKWSEIPFVFLMLVVGFTAAYFLLLSVDDRKYRNNSISRNSIKAAIDFLPTGLCLAEPGGRLLLSNYKMNELCERICEEKLQDANLFWQMLQEESAGFDPTYAELPLEDGTWWAFTRNTDRSARYPGSVTRITAVDITEQKQLSAELSLQNRLLEERNLRLKKYGADIARITREKERLSFKTRIHREMGQLLLTVRHALRTNQDPDLRELIPGWKRQIHALANEEDTASDSIGSIWEQLNTGAELVGLRIELDGSLPDHGTAFRLITEAAAEAMTNAVRHAGAHTIRIRIRRDHGRYRIEFENDGKQPEKEIRLGGGLGSLQKKLETNGGNLLIQSMPFFKLSVWIPEEMTE